MKTLGGIFDSEPRVKIMRLFLFNEDQPYDIEDIVERSKVTKPVARKELKILEKVGFLRAKSFTKEVTMKRKISTRTSKTKHKRHQKKHTH